MAEVVFHACLAALVYTYSGYPMLIGLWARLRPRAVRRGSVFPSVAMIVVAHNEEANIRDKLQTCFAQDYPADLLRVIVATDGSTDRTEDLVKACSNERLRVLVFDKRRGKAACLADAAAVCNEDVLVFTDARQALNPEAVRCLVESFFDPGVGVVSGNLMLLLDDQKSFADGVGVYWRYEKLIRRSEALVHSVPGASGALYAIRRRCFRPIPAGTILDDVAIPMHAIRAGYRVVFDERAMAYDRASTSARQEKLRKVRTLAGNYQLLQQMPWLLAPLANPIFIQFVSHKVLRLAAPFAMVGLLWANALLARGSYVYTAALLGQLAGYALAVAASVHEGVARWSIARLASTFLLLNWYAVLGLLHFLAGRDAHLWRAHADGPQAKR